MIIAFTEFRHPTIYGLTLGSGPRRRSTRRSSRRRCWARAPGSCGGTRRPRRIFMGDTGSLAIGGAMAGLALLTRTQLLLPVARRAPADRDALGDRPGHLVPRLPAPGAAHGADPPPLRGRRLVGVHGHRAVLAVRRRSASRSRSASSTPTSSTSSGTGSSDARRRDRAGRDRRRGRAARLRAEGWDVVVLEDAPGIGAEYADRVADRARDGRARRRAPRPGRDAVAAVAAADLVVPSPLVRPDHPAIVAARAAGVAVRSEIDLAAERTGLPDRRGHRHEREDDGDDADRGDARSRRVAARSRPGNIGRPLLDAVDDVADVLVAEVSSFQLAFSETFRPRVAVLLAITPDHLDWHGTFEHYVAAKARITAHQHGRRPPRVRRRRRRRVAPIARRSAARTVGVLGAAPTRTGASRVVDDRLVAPDGRALAAVGEHAPRVRPRSHERARGRGRRARGGRDTAGVRDALANVRDPPPSRRSGRRSWWGAVVRRLEGDEPRRDVARASRRSIRSCCSRAGATRDSTSACSAEAADRLRGVVAFGEAGARGRGRVRASVPVVTAVSMHDAVRAARRSRAARRRRCCSRPRARRSTRTPTTANAATTSPPRFAVQRRWRRRPMTVVTPRLRLPRFDGHTRLGRARVEVVRRHRALPRPAVVRRAVRDGRRAQHRRARDDPLGVVGRRAQRLRLVVVLLQPAADVGARRRCRVPRGVARSTTAAGAAGRRSARRRVRSPSSSC